MCGIIGIVGKQEVAPRLIEGLKRLEYRGYDSAGIATVTDKGVLDRRRAQGRIEQLAAFLEKEPLSGHTGIGHTRWATHGSPTTTNAHPHMTDEVAVVHNGIIENFAALRAELEGQGRKHTFQTQTDTEVVAHLVTDYLQQGLSPQEASFKAFDRLEGAYALVLIFKGHDNLMIGVRHGTPLTVGYGDGENYLASDSYAMAPFTSKITFLQDGDRAVCTREDVQLFDKNNEPAKRNIRQSQHQGTISGKGLYRHFMAKEIHEQPAVVGDTLQAFFQGEGRLPQLGEEFRFLKDVDRIVLAACGTALAAGNLISYWVEDLSRLSMDCHIGSEYRSRPVVFPKNSAFLCITQSGESLDTLEAMRHAKKGGDLTTMTIVNTLESTIEREADLVLRTLAGPEIGVASTKAFTCQLAVGACLALTLGAWRGEDPKRLEELAASLRLIPGRMAMVLSTLEEIVPPIARTLTDSKSMLFLGRGRMYPLAQEGSLKMKEISYIHAEAYAAGELKHGPIALIDENMPIICLAPGNDPLFDKMASNIQENAARGGRIIAITDAAGAARLEDVCESMIIMPETDPVWAPLLYALPLQLLAYHVACIKGTDVDMPRNLAKAVTVD